MLHFNELPIHPSLLPAGHPSRVLRRERVGWARCSRCRHGTIHPHPCIGELRAVLQVPGWHHPSPIPAQVSSGPCSRCRDGAFHPHPCTGELQAVQPHPPRPAEGFLGTSGAPAGRRAAFRAAGGKGSAGGGADVARGVPGGMAAARPPCPSSATATPPCPAAGPPCCGPPARWSSRPRGLRSRPWLPGGGRG